MKRYLFAASGLVAMSLAACGGGSSAGVATIPATVPIVNTVPATQSAGTLGFSVFIPSTSATSASSHSRRTQTISPSVASLSFTPNVAGGVAVTGTASVLAIGPAVCKTVVGGQECTITLAAPLGQDQWLVQTFASNNGTGVPLSLNTLIKTIIAGAANVASLTLNPVLNSMTFTPVSASCSAAGTCVQTLAIAPLDATGATIIGAGIFVNASNVATPITLSPATGLTLQKADGSAATTLLAQATDANLVKIAYDGSATASLGTTNLTVIAGATGVQPATFTLTLAAGTLTAPASISIGNTSPQSTVVPVSEAGFAGIFTQTNTCTGVATVGAAATNGPTTTFSVSQLGGGTCSMVISDGHGGSASVQIVSTTVQLTIQ